MLFIIIAVVFAFTLLVTGCQAAASVASETKAGETTAAEVKGAETTSAAEESPVAETKHNYIMIVHDVSSEFSAEFNRGGTDAAAVFGVDFTYTGTTGIDIPKQTAMFENAIEGGYDGILMTVFDQKAVERGVQKATEKGIVVTTFNIDGEWGTRSGLGYAGAIETKQGKKLGDYFFKEVMQGKGSFVLLPAIADLGVLIERKNGIQEAAAAFPDIKYLGEVEIGTDLSKAATAVENAMTAYPDATAFIGTDHFSEAVANVLVAKKMEGKVWGGAFDITPGMLKAIKLGAIQATMGQNPYLQGFYAVMQLWIYQEKQIPPNELDTGSELVTKDNIDFFLEKYNVAIE
jgi:ABC-type sugar transport system substrate-binding protein